MSLFLVGVNVDVPEGWTAMVTYPYEPDRAPKLTMHRLTTLCNCNCGGECPLGKIGSSPRCTADELREELLRRGGQTDVVLTRAQMEGMVWLMEEKITAGVMALPQFSNMREALALLKRALDERPAGV